MSDKVLIANRGAIATRILRTLKRLNIPSVAIYAQDDQDSLHVRQADQAIELGGTRLSETYLNIEQILGIAREQNVRAIHPGYGFLSERAEFAEACEASGIRFLGPNAEQIRAFGLKHNARALAQQSAVKILPGTDVLHSLTQARQAADDLGFPVILKSSAGGGGIGMRVCKNMDDLNNAWDSVIRLAQGNFGDPRLFVERFVAQARHVEVQAFGDGDGAVLILGDRDCSLQRRQQKVIEEAPAPNLPEALRSRLHSDAQRLLQSVRYRSAGTVEFIYDADRQDAYFLEVNARLQVEHGVTELITGIDLVEWMVRLGFGEKIANIQQRRSAHVAQHAIQARLYAEDPGADHRPSVGTLVDVYWPSPMASSTQSAEPASLRVDSWIDVGTNISAQYDPMLAKLITPGSDREHARQALVAALTTTRLHGVNTNRTYLLAALESNDFITAQPRTTTLAYLQPYDQALEILQPGTQTTIQDLGRPGFWHIGVPPSGPMDARSHGLANQLLGNSINAPTLEFTWVGPTIRFRAAATIVLTGANFAATLNGQALARERPTTVAAGEILQVGRCANTGMRGYLAISGGFDSPSYLGSASTFTLGQFGGPFARAVRAGDVLRWQNPTSTTDATATDAGKIVSADAEMTNDWSIRVSIGPHGAPDFFTSRAINELLDAIWKVHPQSSRTGIRLIGPKPEWARSDGGEAGLHPSNIHDTPYAVGAVDFTGDMPVILGPDGPSLGGFVCPFVVVSDDLWKLGQLRADDRVRFVCDRRQSPLLAQIAGSSGSSDVVIRNGGDRSLLVEFGPNQLDLRLRFHVESLRQQMIKQDIPGILELTPGVRSLQVRFDPQHTQRADVLEHIERCLTLPSRQQRLPSRVVHLPLSWDDPSTRIAIERYTRTVRAEAPWCPSNIEFIRRINGLNTIDEVREIVFSAEYLVLGLGDVYLGAPVATPVDPRHRLVTTKYNPARTWTPENAVGIGGAYLCVYGMEGPGGYQFVGRTVQMWSRRSPPWGRAGADPWLLQYFDRIRFYPVSNEELTQLRREMPNGTFQPRIEQGYFDIDQYENFLQEQATDIAMWRNRQQTAFAAERDRWQSEPTESASAAFSIDNDEQAPAGCVALNSALTGVVARLAIAEGSSCKQGEELLAIEAMKMEMAVEASCDGTLQAWRVVVGDAVTAGQTLAWIKPC